VRGVVAKPFREKREHCWTEENRMSVLFSGHQPFHGGQRRVGVLTLTFSSWGQGAGTDRQGYMQRCPSEHAIGQGNNSRK